MYTQLAILALIVFLYSLVAGRVERSVISGPMIFVSAGLLLGPFGLGWLDGYPDSRLLRTLADLTLALVLFIGASKADLSTLRQQYRIPFRMLLLGMPGTILLGFLVAVVMFDALTIYEAAILATMLAATDAALGKAVISNPSVPARLREGLNVESGLNDGIAVPVLLLFLTLASAGDSGGQESASLLVLRELGVGLLVGVSTAALGAYLLKLSWRRGWLTEIWMQATVIGLAVFAFALAQNLHGSGYIASFSGGMVFGYLAREATHKLVLATETTGETLALLTWLLFGAMVISPAMRLFTWDVVLYALLSLTIIRMLPVYLSLTGTGERKSGKLFLGWFGPRGLASIVFAIMVVNSGVDEAGFLTLVVFCTVILSLVLHGISARPLAAWISRKESGDQSRTAARTR